MSKRNADHDSEVEQQSSSKRARRCALEYPTSSSGSSPPFQQPTALLSFSYTPAHELVFDDSALRYYVPPPARAKLSHAYDRWIRRPEERSRIDGLLRALSRAQDQKHPSLASGVGAVGWRGVLTRILTAPYEEREGWDLNVMCVQGVLYLEEHRSEEMMREKNDLAPRQRLQTYYGYAFESYCTSDSPNRTNVPQRPGDPPGWGGDVDTNVQWCSVVRTKLGDTRLVIGGEVDCVRGKFTGKTDTFIELKTSMTIRGAQDEARFEKKLLKFYMQSFLLGVPEIIVGFRTPSGEVVSTQPFKTVEIPRMVRGKPHAWDPTRCFQWGDAFLRFLRTQCRPENDDETRVWRVTFRPQIGVDITLLDREGVDEVEAGEERVGFLPTWYWDEVGGKGKQKKQDSPGSDTRG
ncbi:RAI1 domain-containing protein [Mycena indigotica]|uniref:Decapping nuclease n=1 Tax=Mycena indigotica TaxID=2126181 RepID=A0A8H6T5I7_9AGAR|nr:RAI1 domain-containing protein [Mycena indigotica]KAF7312470.1 RAI1 domain-containing protein [Mycena indigotica]